MYWRNLAPTSAQEEACAPSKQEMSRIKNFFIAQQTRSPSVEVLHTYASRWQRHDGLFLHRLERKHRAGRMTHDFFSHIADDQALDARPTVRREHDQIN